MAFKKIRHTHILGEKGTTWYVEIWQKDYTGSSIECDLQGEGFEIKWSGQGNTRDRRRQRNATLRLNQEVMRKIIENAIEHQREDSLINKKIYIFILSNIF